MKALPGRPLGGLRGPFKGFSKIRVLDFTRLLPGPYATQLLAELGMKVTKVELPHFPDLARAAEPKVRGVGSLYWSLNDGKKLLSIDFRKPAGLKKVLALAKTADVLIEGFRPGMMEKSGLGWEAARVANPRLIYCSLVGYPPQGPWARAAGHDLNYLSVSGYLGLQGPHASTPPAQFADLAGSMAAVSGVLAALLERQGTKKGRRLTVAMSETIHSWLPVPLAERLAEGQDPGGPRWWNGQHPFYRLYATADGGRLAVAALEKPFSLSLLDAVGRADLKPLLDDLQGNRERLIVELSRLFASGTRDQWVKRLEGKDVCVTPVLGLGEAEAFQQTLRGAP